MSNRLRRHPVAATSAGLLLFAISGCAALSLFSDTHHHTYTSPELEQRLQALELRTAELESRLAACESVPAEQILPTLPGPNL